MNITKTHLYNLLDKMLNEPSNELYNEVRELLRHRRLNKTPGNSRVKGLVSKYEIIGWNPAQALSLAWSEYFENVDASIQVRFRCNDCNISEVITCDKTMKVMKAHKGHDTITKRFKPISDNTSQDL